MKGVALVFAEMASFTLDLVVDVIAGTKCGGCHKRYRNLALHGYIDHAGDVLPPEPSRFWTTHDRQQP